MVVARVDGQAVTFLVDSGSFLSGISSRFAVEHKMRPAKAPPHAGTHLQSDARVSFTGVAGGKRIAAEVQADQFEFAGVNFPDGAVFLTLPIEGGLLGQDYLKLADVDYDFGNGAITLVKVQDCRTSNLAYWTTGSYSMLPLDGGKRALQTFATVLVNGKAMEALFDTGTEFSFITRRAAARAGVKVTPDMKEVGVTNGLDGTPIKTWGACFASMKLGAEEIVNGSLTIGDTESSDFDMLIGADFFMAHHVYVANSQGRIYFTRNSEPAVSTDVNHAILPPQTAFPTPMRKTPAGLSCSGRRDPPQ